MFLGVKKLRLKKTTVRSLTSPSRVIFNSFEQNKKKIKKEGSRDEADTYRLCVSSWNTDLISSQIEFISQTSRRGSRVLVVEPFTLLNFQLLVERARWWAMVSDGCKSSASRIKSSNSQLKSVDEIPQTVRVLKRVLGDWKERRKWSVESEEEKGVLTSGLRRLL